MTAIAVTYSFSNGAVIDASELNQNFSDLVNGLGDATKDLSVNAITAGGAVTFTGAFTTASVYLTATSYTVRVIASASTTGTWVMTLPVSAGTANYALTTNGSGVTAWTAWSTSAWLATTSAPGTVDPYGATGVVHAGIYTASTSSHTGTASGSTAQATSYIRVGNKAMITGHITITTTGAGGFTLQYSLPSFCTNNFSNDNSAHGTFQNNGTAIQGQVWSTSSATTVTFEGSATTASSIDCRFNFMVYIV